MKKIKSSKVKAFAKAAFTFGLASVLLVSCGKDKNKVENSAVGVAPPNSQSNGLQPGQVCPAGQPIHRTFNYDKNSGTLTYVGSNGAGVNGAAHQTFIGIEFNSNLQDSIVVRKYDQTNYQVDLTVYCMGEYETDNALLSTPQVIVPLFENPNTPNVATCPGRVDAFSLYYGQVFNYQYQQLLQVRNDFVPPAACMY